MTVTALTALRRGRVGLHLDGSFACSLHPGAAAVITSGMELSEGSLQELMEASNRLSAKEEALRLLSVRSYSSFELKGKLSARWGEEAAEAAAFRMEELGYLDDMDYARRRVRELARKGRAPKGIERELSRRGLDRDTAGAALIEADIDPELAAAKVVKRKYLSALNDEKGLRRAYNALMRLGYGYDVIRTVLGRLREDEGYYDEREE